MTNSVDPSFYRQREKSFIEHVRALLEDDRLRLPTRRGIKPIGALMPVVFEGEPGLERGEKVKRLMLELGVTDRELQNKMPLGERIEVNLRQHNFWMLKRTVGKLVVACVSPTRELLKGESPKSLSAAETASLIAKLKQSATASNVPATIVLMSTSGFTDDARELASRAEEGVAILASPNDAGGWQVTSSPGAIDLGKLFDPEADEAKRDRVEQYIRENQFDLLSGGMVSEKIASRTQLPLQIVEGALRSYAKQNPGLAARKIDGKMMLFRESSAFSTDPGGSNMPFWETVKGIFRREESVDRKIARLNTERARLGAQRDHAYEEIAAVETKEAELTKGFKEATALAQRRIATEISQLRKDIERRQQILGAIDKKINVINTGVHTLELQSQVSPEKLKSLENVAASSEDVEVGMAALQQLDEEANSVAGIGAADVPDDVQAILDELKGKTEAPPEPATPARITSAEKAPERGREPAAPERRRSEPEPG
jgi:hypothetical protein